MQRRRPFEAAAIRALWIEIIGLCPGSSRTSKVRDILLYDFPYPTRQARGVYCSRCEAGFSAEGKKAAIPEHFSRERQSEGRLAFIVSARAAGYNNEQIGGALGISGNRVGQILKRQPSTS